MVSTDVQAEAVYNSFPDAVRYTEFRRIIANTGDFARTAGKVLAFVPRATNAAPAQFAMAA